MLVYRTFSSGKLPRRFTLKWKNQWKAQGSFAGRRNSELYRILPSLMSMIVQKCMQQQNLDSSVHSVHTV